MNAKNLGSTLTAFVLGACATATIQSRAATDAPAANRPAVITKLADAPRKVAPPKTAEVIHLARGENAYLGKLTMQPMAKVPVHRDTTEEYIHILEGNGMITIDGTTTAVGTGDTIYMPANAEVHFENGDAIMVGLQVFAGPGPAAKYDAWLDPD